MCDILIFLYSISPSIFQFFCIWLHTLPGTLSTGRISPIHYLLSHSWVGMSCNSSPFWRCWSFMNYFFLFWYSARQISSWPRYQQWKDPTTWDIIHQIWSWCDYCLMFNVVNKRHQLWVILKTFCLALRWWSLNYL